MSPYWQRSSENHLPHAYSYARKNIGDDGATGFPVQGSRQNEASDESSIQEQSNTSARGPVQDHFVGRRKSVERATLKILFVAAISQCLCFFIWGFRRLAR